MMASFYDESKCLAERDINVDMMGNRSKQSTTTSVICRHFDNENSPPERKNRSSSAKKRERELVPLADVSATERTVRVGLFRRTSFEATQNDWYGMVPLSFSFGHPPRSNRTPYQIIDYLSVSIFPCALPKWPRFSPLNVWERDRSQRSIRFCSAFITKTTTLRAIWPWRLPDGETAWTLILRLIIACTMEPRYLAFHSIRIGEINCPVRAACSQHPLSLFRCLLFAG